MKKYLLALLLIIAAVAVSAYRNDFYCGSRYYNPRSQICCSGTLRSRPNYGKCCKYLAYNAHTHFCLHGTIYNKMSHGVCGSRAFQRLNHFCWKQRIYSLRHNFVCGKAVVSRHSYYCIRNRYKLSKRVYGLCGQNPFRYNTQFCYKGRTYAHATFQVCGRSIYSRRAYFCYASRPYNFAQYGLCKGRPYLKNSYMCYNNNLYSLNTYSLCGRTIYRKRHHICKSSRIYAVSTYGHCGTRIYNKRTEFCWRNKVLRKCFAEREGKSNCSDVSDNYNKQLPRSCKRILDQDKHAPSGLYTIASSKGTLLVYCEMVIAGGGYTFLPRHAASFLSDGDLENLYTERDKVLLRILRTDGRQSFTLLRQLKGKQGHKISIQRDRHHRYAAPVNHRQLGHYIYLGFLPSSVARARTVQGFRSNGHAVQFKNCDRNPNSFFAFFENAQEKTPSPYHNKNLIYERAGVAVAWRKTGVVLHSLRNLPSHFFFLTELHFGGCGTYTSSDRWSDAIGTAIGVR